MRNLAARARLRAVTEARQLAIRRLREPSFTAKFHEYARIRKTLARQGIRDPAFTVNAKDDAHAWVSRLGIRTPELVGVFDDVTLVPWNSLPDSIVIKPTRGTTSTGVYLLHRAEGGWDDVYRQRFTTSDDLTAALRTLADDGAVSRSVLVEELIVDPRFPRQAPIDYKVHVFYGTVGMVECKSHSVDEDGEPVGHFYTYDSQWRPLGDGNAFNDPRVHPPIPPPLHRKAVLEMARTISACLPRPYVRVDLFDDELGPVFGELTPEMGGILLLNSAVDRELGELWEDAEARLRVRSIKAGWLDPADAPQDEAFLQLDRS